MNAAPSSPHRPLALLLSMAHTRLELAALDFEANIADSVTAAGMGVAALVLALIGFAFAGLVLIAFFWDTHRLIATAATTGGYFALALFLAFFARRRWKSRRPAFAAVLHEMARDREALRGGP